MEKWYTPQAMAITSDRKLKGLTTDQLKGLHEAASGGGGYKTKGYDDSNDVSVDYTPTAQDFADGRKTKYSHYDPSESQMEMRADGTSKNPQWGLVRDAMGFKDVNSEKDLQAMHRAVNQEYMARTVDSQTKGLEDRLSALEGAPKSEGSSEEESTELSSVAQQAIEGTDDYEQGKRGESYDFLNKKMQGMETSTNEPSSETTQLPTENPNYKGSSGIEDYGFQARERSLSYDPDKGSDPKSVDLMNQYKDGIKDDVKSVGLETRGPKMFLQFGNGNGGE